MIDAANVPVERLKRSVSLPVLWSARRLRPEDTLPQVPLTDELQKTFGLPVVCDKNARAMAIGESWFGAGVGARNMALLNIGLGVSAGIICENALVRGTSGLAGEVGHSSIVPDGPLCVCGKRGCLEALASGPAIVARARELMASGEPTTLATEDPATLNAEAVARAAYAGDVLAQRVLQETATYIGIAVAGLVNLLNPELVILGGGVMRSGPLLLPRIYEVVKDIAHEELFLRTQIVLSKLGDEAAAIGAATHALLAVRLLPSRDGVDLKGLLTH